jgi:DnaA family protein
MSVQLPLGIRLRPDATFASFVPGRNAEAVDFLRNRFDAGQMLYIWGGTGTGKTHLLHAACQAVSAAGGSVVYLPFARIDELAPEMLDGLESLSLICMDDVEHIAGHEAWERRVFGLFNAVRERSGRLLAAANAAPRSLGLSLPDLATRFGWGLVFQLQPLGDEDLGAALAGRARALGIDLPDEVTRYLLQRFARDVTALFALLDRLDRESLSAQRRLTVPFVRSVIERGR